MVWNNLSSGSIRVRVEMTDDSIQHLIELTLYHVELATEDE